MLSTRLPREIDSVRPTEKKLSANQPKAPPKVQHPPEFSKPKIKVCILCNVANSSAFFLKRLISEWAMLDDWRAFLCGWLFVFWNVCSLVLSNFMKPQTSPNKYFRHTLYCFSEPVVTLRQISDRSITFYISISHFCVHLCLVPIPRAWNEFLKTLFDPLWSNKIRHDEHHIWVRARFRGHLSQ